MKMKARAKEKVKNAFGSVEEALEYYIPGYNQKTAYVPKELEKLPSELIELLRREITQSSKTDKHSLARRPDPAGRAQLIEVRF